MTDLNIYHIVQIGGMLLALVMFVLLAIGTYSLTTFMVWGVLAVVGVGIFAGARKLDEAARDSERKHGQ